MAANATEPKEINQKNEETDGMQQLIDGLQRKVEELISAGMMKKIEKYAPK